MYTALEKELNYFFTDKKLLYEALTHASYAHATCCISNERLEFLGDSVLNFAVSTLLFQLFPNEKEGILSSIRAYLVSRKNLYTIACTLSLEKYILIGESVQSSTLSPRIIANTLEALFGAIYCDGGIDAATHCIHKFITPQLSTVQHCAITLNYKTRLQEYLQKTYHCCATYVLVATETKDQKNHYTVSLQLPNGTLYTEKGFTKRNAEQACAKQALIDLGLL